MTQNKHSNTTDREHPYINDKLTQPNKKWYTFGAHYSYELLNYKKAGSICQDRCYKAVMDDILTIWIVVDDT